MSEITVKQENGIVAESTNPMHLINLAIQNNLDIDKLERLMSLKERYDKEQAKRYFNEAFAKFQAEKPEISKTKDVFVNGEKRYSFAPLPQIQKEIDPVLAKHGLMYNWEETQNENVIKVTCHLKHIGGHSESTSLSSLPDSTGSKNNIQSIGSGDSYLKRYTLMSITGVSSDEDNDGNTTEPTKEEIRLMQYEKLKSLYNEKKEHITNEKIKLRIESIIENEEKTAYQKAIRSLENDI